MLQGLYDARPQNPRSGGFPTTEEAEGNNGGWWMGERDPPTAPEAPIQRQGGSLAPAPSVTSTALGQIPKRAFAPNGFIGNRELPFGAVPWPPPPRVIPKTGAH